MGLQGNICNIVAALGFGNNISVCGKLEIGVFNGGTAQLKFLRAFPQGWHTASWLHTAGQDQVAVIMADLQIQNVPDDRTLFL